MSEYTAEEYREVLNKIYGMDSEKRAEAFGKDEFVTDYVEHYSAQEIIEKYRAYVNTPKAGEYWKNNDGTMIIVRYIKNNIVFYYMMIASQVTTENIDTAKETIQDVADYIVDAVKEIKDKEDD